LHLNKFVESRRFACYRCSLFNERTTRNMTGKVCENNSLESCASLHHFGFILRAYVTQEVVIPENGERDPLEKCPLVSIANVAEGGGKIGPPGISYVTSSSFAGSGSGTMT
jgi:hypothetical protein